MEMTEKKQERLFWAIWAGSLSGIITALALYAPGVLQYLALFMGILVPAIIIFVGAARALQEKPVPLPETGWIGIEVPVSDVLPAELAPGESPEDWKGTAGSVTPPGFQGEEVLTEREKLRRQLVARRREGQFHVYGDGKDVPFQAQESEEEEEGGRTVYVTEYNLRK